MVSPRTHEIDVIRLVALLGICLVNIPTMGIFETTDYTVEKQAYDQYAIFFRSLFIDGKFILLFSFVLGWGIAVQQKRITEAGHSFAQYYFRRSFGLMFLGFLHMVFIFDGDILFSYGVMCLLFWPMREYVLRTPLKVFLRRMLILNYFIIVASGFILFQVFGFEGVDYLTSDNMGLSKDFYEASEYRLIAGSQSQVSSAILFTVEGLAAFGLGYAAEYKGFFKKDSEAFQKLGKRVPIFLIVGLVFTIPMSLVLSEFSENIWVLAGTMFMFFSSPLLSAVYLYFLVRFARRVKFPEVVILAGRNSLSVYVLQGLIASLFFCGYGFGMFDELGELALIPLGISIYAVTILIVGLYAKRFGRGFLEPVLRKVTGSYPSKDSTS